MQAIRNVLEKHEKMALLVGNGPNLAAQIMPNWKQLLKSISNPPIDFEVEGLSNTEVYDLVDLHSKEGHDVKAHVIRALAIPADTVDLPIHKRIMQLAQEFDTPVLTTNFDTTFEKSIDAKLLKINSKGFTRYYPWKTYYGFEQHTLPTDGFGVWKVHGDVRYKDSIRLGLTDYMGSVERARGMIHKGNTRLFRGKQDSYWKGQDTWLHIWFKLPVVVFGLGFGLDEVFLRWLLIERRRYRNFHKEPMQVYYISKSNIAPSTQNLMQNLGVEIVTIQEYSELYG